MSSIRGTIAGGIGLSGFSTRLSTGRQTSMGTSYDIGGYIELSRRGESIRPYAGATLSLENSINNSQYTQVDRQYLTTLGLRPEAGLLLGGPKMAFRLGFYGERGIAASSEPVADLLGRVKGAEIVKGYDGLGVNLGLEGSLPMGRAPVDLVIGLNGRMGSRAYSIALIGDNQDPNMGSQVRGFHFGETIHIGLRMKEQNSIGEGIADDSGADDASGDESYRAEPSADETVVEGENIDAVVESVEVPEWQNPTAGPASTPSVGGPASSPASSELSATSNIIEVPVNEALGFEASFLRGPISAALTSDAGWDAGETINGVTVQQKNIGSSVAFRGIKKDLDLNPGQFMGAVFDVSRYIGKNLVSDVKVFSANRATNGQVNKLVFGQALEIPSGIVTAHSVSIIEAAATKMEADEMIVEWRLAETNQDSSNSAYKEFIDENTFMAFNFFPTTLDGRWILRKQPAGKWTVIQELYAVIPGAPTMERKMTAEYINTMVRQAASHASAFSSKPS